MASKIFCYTGQDGTLSPVYSYRMYFVLVILPRLNCPRVETGIRSNSRAFTSEVGKMTTFYLWPIPLPSPWGGGHGVQGAWGPQLAMNRFLPLLATQIPTLWIHTSGGALILDRCRAFDLFASVDAHLWTGDVTPGSEVIYGESWFE
jgi:hypothetical protein